MTDSTRTGSGDIRTAGEQGNDQGNDQDRDQSVGRWKLIVARRPTHHGHCMAGDRGRGNAGRRQRLLRVERVEQPVADAVIFSVPKGQFVCIIGHSGWGKTTILNVLAGLDQASDGTVIMDERDVVGPSLERGVVFQGHALMPWLSVRRKHRLRRAQQVARLEPRAGGQTGREVRRPGRPEWRDPENSKPVAGRHEATLGDCTRLRHRAENAAAGRHGDADEQRRPQARIAEVVRNYRVDFLVSRSRDLAHVKAPEHPPEI